jgi:hypothetical protein
MNPTLLALKAALVLAATDAQNEAKILATQSKPLLERYNLGRLHAFQEVLRLIETVSHLEKDSK